MGAKALAGIFPKLYLSISILKLNETNCLYSKEIQSNTLPKDPSKAVSGTFYHGIILRKGELGRKGEQGWYAALNLLESGMLQTPNYIAYWNPSLASRHRSARYDDIKDLQYLGQSSGGLTPIAMTFINVASGIRQGQSIQMGSTRFIDDIKRKIIDRSRVEIKFELGRRIYAKKAVSRLESLYVADNKSTIEEMFHHDPNLIIFKVKIAEALNYTQVDSKWYEEYYKTKNRKCIKRYWTGHKYDESISRWEYLVDGLLIIDDPESLARLSLFKKELEDEFKCSISTSQEILLFMAFN